MISFEDALDIVLGQDPATEAERVSLDRSPGRILAEDIISDIDMPPFDKSAVDGFACRMGDILDAASSSGTVLKIVETIPAGKIPRNLLNHDECSRIMTGAMVPGGADCVVMVENTEPVDEEHVRILSAPKNRNICYRAEDIVNGTRILEKGSRIRPAHVAVMAAVGVTNPLVTLLTSVGIISTGDELVEPSVFPTTGKIRNSNGWQLEAQVRSVPASPHYLGIAPDEGPVMSKIVRMALENHDLVLLTGGVSMGDFDYVPGILQKADVEILFRKIAIQPGKPTVFGKKGNTFVFGLPGNPVSSFVLFEMLVRPFLLRLAGSLEMPRNLFLPMGCDYSRKFSDRKSMIPVTIRDGAVWPVAYHGSAHINAYSQAEAILMIEPGITMINEGEIVHVRPI